MTNPKLVTALLIPLLVISMAGFAYSHWTDSVKKNYYMHVGCTEAEIKTYKLLSPWSDDLIDKWPSDDELEAMHGTTMITFSTYIGPGWYVWIGFIIQNQGMFPARIDPPTYQVTDPDNIWGWFIREEYYYGQIIGGTTYGWPRNDVPKGLYDHVHVLTIKQIEKGKTLPPNAVDPPPPSDVPPPVYLEPYTEIAGSTSKDSMIMWIFLQLDPAYPSEDPFSIEISIIVTAELAFP